MKRTIITVILTLAFTAFAIQAVEQTALSGAGIIQSTTGGFKFPDGSVQLSAANLPCTAITYIPYVIVAEGVYCFTDNLDTSMTSGNAIEVQTDNVVINLNGWKLDGLGAGMATETSGIFSFQHKNITIRNGTIRGFYRGIWLDDVTPYTVSHGHLIEDTRCEMNTHVGIMIQGNSIIVRRNQVVATGGTTVRDWASGIRFTGPGGKAIDNDISRTAATGSGSPVGMDFFESHGAVAEGNRIDYFSTDTGESFGLNVRGPSSDVLVIGNRITGADYGIFYAADGSTGKYRDNLTSGVTTPYTGGTDAGGND